MARARIELTANLGATSVMIIIPAIYLFGYVMLNWVRHGLDWGFLIFPAVVIPPFVIWAIVRARRPALVVDAAGIRGPDDPIDWSGLALVWVQTRAAWFGRSSRIRSATITAWSLAGLEFAQRTGFAPTERTRRTVWSSRHPDQIAAMLQALAPDHVVVMSGPRQTAYLKELRAGGPIFPAGQDVGAEHT